jgi:hypothetical protein
MPDRTVGRFYFKRTSNGNLLGEFSNRAEPSAFTESCDLTEPAPNATNPYEGTYASHWREGQEACYADLTISRKQGTALFRLEWRGRGDAGNFDGEAMLCDDMIVGDYHSVKR